MNNIEIEQLLTGTLMREGGRSQTSALYWRG